MPHANQLWPLRKVQNGIFQSALLFDERDHDIDGVIDVAVLWKDSLSSIGEHYYMADVDLFHLTGSGVDVCSQECMAKKNARMASCTDTAGVVSSGLPGIPLR